MADELKRGVTFQVTWEMYKQLRNISKKKDLTVSYLVRKLVRDFLQSEDSIDTEPEGEITK
jgi:predicted DNA-binding protein